MDSGQPKQVPPAGAPPQLRIEFAGAGWVLLLAALLGLLLLGLLTWPILSGQQPARPLSMEPEQAGFDLAVCLIPREQIVQAAAMGSIPPLNRPPREQGSQAASITREYRRKYHHKFVVEGDRVVGVSINGETRAYQLKILQWHEVVNDELGGAAIAVTYCPLTDSVAVYDRRVAGQLVALAASGMLYNSNTLLMEYSTGKLPSEGTLEQPFWERQAEEAKMLARSYPPSNWPREAVQSGTSLWCQLTGQAVTGDFAAARAQLTLLPCELTHWGDWLKRHPDTTLLSHDTGFNRKYTTNAYGAYFDRMKLRFPVSPAPRGSLHEQFTRMVAVKQADGSWRAWDYPTLKAQPQQGVVRFVYEPWAPGMEPDSVRIAGGEQLPVVYGLRFAFEAFGISPSTIEQ